MIDAYCHVGLARFGSTEDALAVLGQWDVEKAVFALGPGVPDYATLFSALRTYGHRVRGIGIPFGDSAEQIRESVGLQLRAGVMGLRVEPSALLGYPEIMIMLGEQSGEARPTWCYAIGAASSPDVIRALLTWLETYPGSRVAAPHFLSPQALLDSADPGPIRELVGHPRFYPIFSLHGGVGSRQPYPHRDLFAWVEKVIALAGWDHILWGSEYPVLFWRNETVGAQHGAPLQDRSMVAPPPASALQWLFELLGETPAAQRAAYLGANAQRAIFDSPMPPMKEVEIPDWVDEQFDRDRVVPLFPGGLDVPMTVYQSIHHAYVAALQQERWLTFAGFVTRHLKEIA
jgi:hypothetical protein